ncbi:MAG: citrate synthase [Gammaproteobacteria bacterium]|jgi:citrate synthase
MANDQAATTKICGFDADNIIVRNRDLVNDLMGKVSFTEMIFIQSLGQSPSPSQTKILDAVLVTIMEHGLVPSAITTRLTHYGAPESFQGAVVAGLLGVGDRYAGTASECGELLEKIVNAEINIREQVAIDIIRDYRQRRRPLPGFGHPIHQQKDPRVSRLLDIVAETEIEGNYISAMNLLETSLNEELGKNLVTNVSAAIAAVLGEANIPSGMMRGIVLTARCAGLVGHVFEEMQNPIAPNMWQASQAEVSYEK